MRTPGYRKLVPLLLFAAACQPQQPQPESTATSPPPADSRMGESRDAARQPMAKPAPQRIAEVKIAATAGNNAGGTVRFLPQDGGGLRVEGTLTGLTPGAHGLHIHANGDCSAPDATSAGGHFSPNDNPHGSPQAPADKHHAGDLGNVTAGADGSAEVAVDDTAIGLSGPASIIGKALVVHAGRDDLESQPSGDSGDRVGCGVIREAARSAADSGERDAADRPTSGGGATG